MLTIEEGLDQVPSDRFGNQKQTGGRQHHAPARVDRRGQRHREERSDNAAHEGHEAA
jgi:hypothetical protein